eukprot:gene29026-32778_t
MAIFPEFQKTWATSKVLPSLVRLSNSASPRVNLPLVTSTEALVALITIQMKGNSDTAANPNYAAGTGEARGAVRLFGFSDGNFSGASLRSNIGSGYNGTADYNLTLADGALFGSSVALDATGSRLAVGAVGENGGAGSVRMFELWSTEKPRLASTIDAGPGGAYGTANARQFGTSVALNGSGNKLAVGAVNDSGGSGNCVSCGAVYLYTNGSLSTTLGANYATSFNPGTEAQLGSAVALNAAGDKLAVGAVGVDDMKGAVYTFSWAGMKYSETSYKRKEDSPFVLTTGLVSHQKTHEQSERWEQVDQHEF